VAEPGSDVVRTAMQSADGWYMCRVGFVETIRAVGLAAGERATQAVRREWPSFGVVEVDGKLAERAAELVLEDDLRSLDALHLAAALLLPPDELVLATWDRRLHASARAHRIEVLPAALP